MKIRKAAALLLVSMQLFFNAAVSPVSAVTTEGYYEWTFNEGTYTNGGKTLLDESGTNSATLKDGKATPTFTDGLIKLSNNSFYLLQKPITLAQNKRWRVEWKGKMEAGTSYSCQTILGNEGAEQYVMYGANAIFLGNKNGERLEIPCNRDAVAYKETSYILEGDGNRRARLTYQVSGEQDVVVSDWYDYPAAVKDVKVTALFGSYLNILYKGYLDYVRVWEEYPEQFTYSVSDNKATVTGYLDEPQGDMNIPDSLGGFPVKAIGPNAFEGCSKITEITLPEGMESVGESAFKGCSALKAVTIPATVTAIGDGAFAQSGQAVLKVYYGSFAHDYVIANSLPYELIEEPNFGIVEELQLVDSAGNRIYGSNKDMSKERFYLTGTIQNKAKARDNALLCVLAMYDDSGKLLNAGVKQVAVPAQSTYTMTLENGVHIEGVPAQKGMKMKAYLFTEEIQPVAEQHEIFFDGKFSGSIKMLSIGNSYSIDASTMVHDIAAADGVDINILNLHIGGCTLETHWANAQSGAAAYASQWNGIPAGTTSMQTALKQEEWDYVSLQQGSHESNDFSKFWTEEKPYLTNMSGYVKQLAPQATQLVHETWAYQNQRAIERLGYFGSAPLARNAMFRDVKDAYMQAADKLGVNILPSGEAVQKALNEFGFTEAQMYRDSNSHLTEDKGRYLVAAVWYASLTGNSILTNPYQPEGISSDELQRLKQAAHDAVQMAEYQWK